MDSPYCIFMQTGYTQMVFGQLCNDCAVLCSLLASIAISNER
jgi:hypothetical protein